MGSFNGVTDRGQNRARCDFGCCRHGRLDAKFIGSSSLGRECQPRFRDSEKTHVDFPRNREERVDLRSFTTVGMAEDLVNFPGRLGALQGRETHGPECKLSRLGSLRAENRDFKAAPPRSKPADPANFGCEDMLRRAVGGFVVKLGPSHPTTIRTMHDLGLAVLAQKRPLEASRILREAHAAGEETFGPCHPVTLAIAASLADALRADFDGNEEVHGDAATTRRQASELDP